MRSVTRLSTALGAIGLALAFAAPAHAGGFTTTRFGGEHGHAGSADVSAIFYNPAGLPYGAGTRAYVEGLFVYRSVDYNRDAAAIDDAGASTDAGGHGTPTDLGGVAANSGKATLANAVVSPFIGIATDAGIRGLGVGFALSVPFGGQASWDKVAGDPRYPGAADSSARWASIEGSQRSIYYTLAAGWRTRDGKFGVGAGLNIVSSEISLVRARNLDGSDDLVLGASGAAKEGRALLEVKGLDLAASVGVMVKPTPCSRIGISYHSQPGFGEQTLEGDLTVRIGSGAPGAVPIELKQQLPDSLRIGGEWRAREKVTLHFAIDYQRWSKFKAQCIVNPGAPANACETDDDGNLVDVNQADVNTNIVRNWKDTYGIRVGGQYHVNEQLEVNGGVLYDSNAVPDSTLDPALIDQDKVIPQLGVRFVADKFLVSATLGQVFYFDRTTAPRTVDPEGKNRSPDMAGDYAQSVSYLLFGVGGMI